MQDLLSPGVEISGAIGAHSLPREIGSRVNGLYEIVDVLLLPKLFGIKRDLSSVVQWRDMKSTNWLGITAMLVGVIVAIVLSIPGNVIPNVGLSIGIAPVEGWLAATALYLAMIAIVRRKSDLRWTIGLAMEAAE